MPLSCIKVLLGHNSLHQTKLHARLNKPSLKRKERGVNVILKLKFCMNVFRVNCRIISKFRVKLGLDRFITRNHKVTNRKEPTASL
jgi:hypothetical protein